MRKETYYMWKQTYFIRKEPYFSRKEPYCSPKEPYFSRKEPYFSGKEPSENRLIFRGQWASILSDHIHSKKDWRYATKRPTTCENRDKKKMTYFPNVLRDQHTWSTTSTPKEIYDKVQGDPDMRIVLVWGYEDTSYKETYSLWKYKETQTCELCWCGGIKIQVTRRPTPYEKTHIHSKRDLTHVTKRPLTW